MPATPSLVSFGQVSLDTISNRKGKVMNIIGGPALNVAIVTSFLRVKTGVVSRIGMDYPGRLESEIRTQGIDITGLIRKRGQSTRISLRYNGPKLIDLRIEKGVNSRLSAQDFPSYYYGARLIHLAPAPFLAHSTLSRRLSRKGMLVSVDPHLDYGSIPFQEIEMVLHSTDFLFGNEREIQGIAKRPVLKNAINRVLRAGVQTVLVTRGSEGVQVFSKSESFSLKAFESPRIIDFVGAGDAFAGGFLATFLRTEDIFKSARIGMMTSAYALRDFGLMAYLRHDSSEFKKVISSEITNGQASSSH
jgi:sugar/nucleoside kinase (ribokinase family)